MSVLVDTSVWVAHFRRAEPHLMRLLVFDEVLGHPLVLGELACGTPPERQRTIRALALQRQAAVARHVEVLEFLERQALFGKGCGYIDIALLAATRLTPGARLWTYDLRLEELARTLELQYSPPSH